MVIIREAVLSDVPELLAIYNYYVRTSAATFDLAEQTLPQRQEWFSHYGGPYPLLVAELDGCVVGYSSLSRFRPKPAYDRTAELSVYVAPDKHGHGIGRKLMEELLRLAEELNYHTLIAGITAGNEVSVKLHEKFGFELIGCFKEVGYKFEQWQDVFFYQKIMQAKPILS